MSLMIDVRKLGLFNQMAKAGGETVADHLGQMTGMDTEMEITTINFIDIPDILTHVGDAKQIGIGIELLEPPHGHVLFLFRAADAKRLARGMLRNVPDAEEAETGFSEMERSAIREVGNVLTSGFIDGWANVLETTIDISPPKFTFGPSSGMVEELVGDRETSVALMFDSRIQALDADVDLTVYTFPKLEELVGMMQRLDVEAASGTLD